VGVVLVAADLVDGALRETHHVERVKRDLRVGEALADRLLIAAGHVDRGRADRLLALAEQIEERLQRRCVAARGAPHDRTGSVVDEGRQVALPPCGS